MDNVNCIGFESSLTHCLHAGWGEGNCDQNHNEDAGVVCDNSTVKDLSNNFCRQVNSGSCADHQVTLCRYTLRKGCWTQFVQKIKVNNAYRAWVKRHLLYPTLSSSTLWYGCLLGNQTLFESKKKIIFSVQAQALLEDWTLIVF